jgi:hypothetical protein
MEIYFSGLSMEKRLGNTDLGFLSLKKTEVAPRFIRTFHEIYEHIVFLRYTI